MRSERLAMKVQTTATPNQRANTWSALRNSLVPNMFVVIVTC